MGRWHAWTTTDSAIWRTLTYPLPALNLTIHQCERIMRPILHYSLPALGVCRNFPRDIVFTPHKYMGLGFRNLHTIQETSQLKDMLHHTFSNSMTGELYRVSTEFLIIELGMSVDFSQVDYNELHFL
jgi:hypothetical protein